MPDPDPRFAEEEGMPCGVEPGKNGIRALPEQLRTVPHRDAQRQGSLTLSEGRLGEPHWRATSWDKGDKTGGELAEKQTEALTG